MKVVVAALLLIGCSSCYSAETPVIGPAFLPDLIDFMSVIPVSDIMDVVQKHMENDPGFGAGIKYLQSKEWNELMERMFQTTEFKDFKQHLMKMGIPLEFVIKFGFNILRRAKPQTIGENIDFTSFIDDVQALIPVDKLTIMFNDKLKTSEGIKTLFEQLQSKETFKLAEKFRTAPETKLIINQLKKMGIKVDDYLQMIYMVLNWGTISD